MNDLYIRDVVYSENYDTLSIVITKTVDGAVTWFNGKKGEAINKIRWSNGDVIVDLTGDSFKKETPLKLISDGCGDLYCPRCKTWMAECHKRDGKLEIALSSTKQNYCDNCGQRLIWEIGDE